MRHQGAQAGDRRVLTNQRNLEQDSQSWASAGRSGTLPPAAAAAEVLGATSPSTARLENCSEGVAGSRGSRRRFQTPCKSGGFSKSRRGPGRKNHTGFHDTGLPSLLGVRRGQPVLPHKGQLLPMEIRHKVQGPRKSIEGPLLSPEKKLSPFSQFTTLEEAKALNWTFLWKQSSKFSKSVLKSLYVVVFNVRTSQF